MYVTASLLLLLQHLSSLSSAIDRGSRRRERQTTPQKKGFPVAMRTITTTTKACAFASRTAGRPNCQRTSAQGAKTPPRATLGIASSVRFDHPRPAANNAAAAAANDGPGTTNTAARRCCRCVPGSDRPCVRAPLQASRPRRRRIKSVNRSIDRSRRGMMPPTSDDAHQIKTTTPPDQSPKNAPPAAPPPPRAPAAAGLRPSDAGRCGGVAWGGRAAARPVPGGASDDARSRSVMHAACSTTPPPASACRRSIDRRYLGRVGVFVWPPKVSVS